MAKARKNSLFANLKSILIAIFIVLIVGLIYYFYSLNLKTNNKSYSKSILLKIFLGLFIYCGIFAINSSIHSYLILRFSNKNRVSLDVGFYYMANATGRLIGTFLSGLTYQLGGLTLSLTTASFMIGVCLCFTHLLKES